MASPDVLEAAEAVREHSSELKVRREARERLIDFTRYTYSLYEAEPVHELIASHLDRVVAGKCKRLMIFSQPQIGKSQLVAVHLPAFWLARRPDDPVIVTSYAASLVYSKSRHARAIVESTEFQRLFPGIETNRLSRAVDHWEIQGRRGSVLAAGVGGPITGHGAALGIIDDPVENWEHGQSQTQRDKVWDWWQSTFRTRIWQGGAIVLIMTRWHDDDLAGRLLRQQADRWEVLRLPAVAETQKDRDENNRFMGLPTNGADPLARAPGEPLAPRRFDTNELKEIRRDVGSVVWGSLYQGVPRPIEGSMFKRN